MKKLSLAILLNLVFSPVAVAQKPVTGTIEWQEPILLDGEKHLYFSGAAYTDQWGGLPVHTELIRLSASTTAAQARVEFTQSRSWASPGTISGLDKAAPEILIKSQVVYIRKAPYLRISFVPLTTSGKTQVELATRYTIYIEEKHTGYRKKLKRQHAQNSILSSGKWVRIKCSQNGLYKLTYEELAAMGFSNPANVSLWGQGSGMLPLTYDQTSPDDLEQSPIYMEMGADGQFGAGDYLLFWGEGPHKWHYSMSDKHYWHEYHLYADANYYYLTDGQAPLYVKQTDNSNLNATATVSSYDDYAWHEKQEVNLIKSGRQMYGEAFDIQPSQTFTFNFDDIQSGASAKLITRLLARSSSNTSYTLSVNGATVATPGLQSINLGSYLGTYASVNESINSISLNNATIELTISFNKSTPSDMGWLDYIYLNVRRPLSFSSGQMAFRDINSVSDGAVAQFNINIQSSNIRVWDVSQIGQVSELSLNSSGQGLSFKAPADTLHQYVAFDGSRYLSPVTVGEVQNQNLHGREPPDMVIVTHPAFLGYASELANYRESASGLDVLVVTPEQVYNEFSAGKTDISAIRNLMKHYYDQASSPLDMLRYLLLFGDGSYNNTPGFLANHNFLPTYQSFESLSPTVSHVSDDFFGLLDDNENLINGAVDIGIGRLPVLNSQQASAMVNKIKTYESASSMGDWRNMISFIADDQDNPNNYSHMNEANELSLLLKDNHPVCNLEKIFLDAYKQETSSTGERYPDAVTAINNRVRRGALIMNYTGHGGETGLAEESIISIPQILGWENLNNMPLFVTATCEFSRFDDYERTSAGEWVLLNPVGGGIGLLTTTRVVYSSPNYQLNRNFYLHVFDKDSTISKHYRLGDIFRLTKNSTASSVNKRNFTLLGDPSLMLNYPEHKVQAESINSTSISQKTDTLKAFSKITVSAYVTDEKGILLDDFYGTAYSTVYDKSREINTLANDGGEPFTFELQNSVLYRGKSKVEKGRFSFTFIVPKDIAYNYGKGKVSFYVKSGESDGHGQFDEIIVGGTADSIPEDKTGPRVELYMNDENFVYGGTTDDSPVFIAQLRDSSGINTVGNGIGHEITMYLDEETTELTVLNDYFEADLDSYQSGEVEYPLNDLEEGAHTLNFKAWDIYNNSSEDEIAFVVIKDQELTLSHILNYPNPFSTNTSFFFEHNRPGTELDILIQVFTVSGKLVKSIRQSVTTEGYRISGIPWDGRDDFGDPIGRGVYIYKVSVRSADGQKAEHYEKLVIFTP